MKNLRKVLALVLVVATLMGFAAMASATFTDDAKVANVEAVELLAALNIINGYEVAEGKYEYRPENPVTRAEMAKMIYVILNNGTDDKAEDYKAACSYADAAATVWAAGYVAYCEQEGIISGYTDGTFKPSKNISVLEAAKMALCALGYDAAKAGFEGADWAKNVNTAAGKAKLYVGVTQSGNAVITRQNAAQILLNALKASTVVERTGDINISINGTSISGDTKKEYYNTNTTLAEVKFGGVITTAEVAASATTAAFGAPQYQILIDNTVKATINYKPVATLKGVVTVADVMAAVNQKTIAGAVVTVDGAAASATDLENGWSSTKATADAAKKVKLSGNAATVEVYLTDAGVVYAVVKNLYLGRVGAYQSSTKDYTFYTELAYGSNGVAGANVKNEAGLKDLVLYNKDEGATVLVEQFNTGANKIVGKVSGLTGTAGTIDAVTINGVKYTFAENNKIQIEGSGTLENTMGQEMTIYVDGTNILYASCYAPAETYKYAYLLAVQTVSDSTQGWDDVTAGADTYNGKLLLIDNDGKVTTEIVKLASDSLKVKGNLYKYTVNNKGEYKLATDTSVAAITSETNLKVAGAKMDGYIVNNATLYVTETIDAATGKVTYNGYVGAANVANVKSSNVAVYYKSEKIGSANYNVAKLVYAFDVKPATSTAPVASDVYGIILKTGSESFETVLDADKNPVKVYAVKAYINGKAETLKFAADKYATLSTAVIVDITLKDGLVDAYTTFATAAADTTDTIHETYKIVDTNGTIVVGKLAGNDDFRNISSADATAYVLNVKNGANTFSTKKFSELTNKFDGFAVLDKNGVITLLVGTDEF